MINLLRGIFISLVASAAIGQVQAAESALTKVGDLQAATRPFGVPLEYVVTPGGYFHPSCVARLADDERVLEDGSILRADGNRREVAVCAHPSFGTRGERRAEATHRPDGSFDGWLADSLTDPSVTPPASAMVATWVVPAAPTTATGQTLYFFPGLESVPNTFSILQPVLAWDGYGNLSWTMANWNCCINGTIYTGKPIPVSTGDRILGTMTGTGCTATAPCSAWKVVSTDLTTKKSVTMNTHSFGQIFNWYFGGVMEVYGVSSCDQFPANGGIDFKNVKVLDVNSQPVTPVWSTEFSSTAPACNYAVNATTNETTISFSTTAAP